MDESLSKTVGGKCLRPVRNRRYSRKSFAVGQRPAKRLFTPEIKRFLKEWLIRRRENPYPNREEKKVLAVETGLTYIQICNWFANWRRKLKNAGNERHRKTWGHLIKTYNNHAQGNVEQFSICSDDSIWGEPDPASPDTRGPPGSPGDHCYSAACSRSRAQPDPHKLNAFSKLDISQADSQYNAQCYHVSSTTEECKQDPSSLGSSNAGNKYKSHIMEKYLRGLKVDPQPATEQEPKPAGLTAQPVLLTKWLESAAKFQPCESNYVTWNASVRGRSDKRRRTLPKTTNREDGTGQGQARASPGPEYRSHDLNHYSLVSDNPAQSHLGDAALDCDPGSREPCVHGTPCDHGGPCSHGREEVEAAVTLTRLASLYRS